MRLWRSAIMALGMVPLGWAAPGTALGQEILYTGPLRSAPAGMPGFYDAPGSYGTSYGTPSYGLVRTYSEFASPFGAGKGYGYGPSTFLPGRYGVGLWRPGQLTAAQAYAGSAHSYRTWAVPYVANGRAVPVPPFGAYAPALGPGFPGP